MHGRLRLSTGALLLAIACGRSPVATSPVLLVQVVDELGDGVPRAEVELRENGQMIDHAATDPDGVVAFRYPGEGDYLLRARTEPICCVHEGELATSVTGWDELLVVETFSGPCPTWVPSSCD